jgi:class 3 adenylate cyclase/tetratricopeptide (TPR) repeat protein
MTESQAEPGRDRCRSCGADVTDDARFCHACGTSLRIACPTCGSEQRAGTAFCSACGTSLGGVARQAAEESEERRVVTVLFADLANSTALGERLDPEDMRSLLTDLFELVNGQVELHGGVTEKYVGDAILAVFGVPQAHEDDAERAVRAALGMRDVFAAFARRVADDYDAEVGLRVGVNTGDVIATREAAAGGERIVTGDAVNVAARLQQLAEPGEVLVGSRTRRATQRVIAYEERGELHAKGKSLPLQAWRARDAVARQGERRLSYAAPLIGRDDELTLLRLAAARVERERAPQLVTVFGHAGVGKSRLVSEFADRVDARVVVGRCVPYGDGITYLPLAEIAASLAGIRDDEPAASALERVRAAAADAVPEEQASQVADAIAWTVGLSLPGAPQEIGVGAATDRSLHDAWATYLAALGRSGLLVVVVEDVHWGSAPLLDLLDDVLAKLEDTAVLVLCPSRPELLDVRPSWGTGRLRSSSVTLAPLGAGDAQRLLLELLDAESIPDSVVRQILEPADGNPFFVEEMLAMLVERGAVEHQGGRWVATEQLLGGIVPDSIQGVIAARLDLLEVQQRDALRRCSVMGRVFWPSAVGIDDDLVASLAGRALVSEQMESSFEARREFAFKHALIHEVAYGTLPRYERGSLHRRVAEWLSGSIPDRQAETTELVAYHYEQALRWGDADPGLGHRAFEALIAAGDSAVRRGAYSSAEGLLARALELAPTEAERARALLGAARIDVALVQYERALSRLDEVVAVADAIGDAAMKADALGFKARAAWLHGSWHVTLRSGELAVAALEGLPDSTELARALARLSQIQMLRALPEAPSTAARAIEVARRTDEKAAEANARINLFTADVVHGAVPTTDEVTRIIDLALAGGAHDEAIRAVVNYLWAAALLDPLEPVEEFVRKTTDERLERGLAVEVYDDYLKLSMAALVYVPAGRWAEVDAAVAREATFATVRLVWLWIVAGQALRRGDLERVDRYLPEFREAALASEEPQRIAPMASVAMPRALLADDIEEISALADILIAFPRPAFLSSPGFLGVARSLAAIGDRGRLEALRRQIASSTTPATVVDSIIGGLLARVSGDGADAARALSSAARELEVLGRLYDAACVVLEAASAFAEAGDTEGARAAQADATAVLEPLGCVYPY